MDDELKEIDGEDWPSDSGSGDWPSSAGSGIVDDGLNDEDNQITDWRIIVENKFYSAELTRREAPDAALREFLDCIAYEEEKTAALGSDEIVKRFDALTHCVLLQSQFSMRDGMIKNYQKLLSIAGRVSPLDLNASIRKILDCMENRSNIHDLNDKSTLDMESEIYSMTLDYFSQQKGKERVWFIFAMRLCKTYLKRENIIECSKILDELHRSCQKEDGSDDSSKGRSLLQIYAIKIQIVTLQKNKIGLSELFDKTNKLVADVDDDASISVIYECWAKMYSSMNDWKKAVNYFFDAFRAYSRIGDERAKQCLKYVIIATMLNPDTKERVNPLATPEATAYGTNTEIMAMNNLLDSFENKDMKSFERQLGTIMTIPSNKNDSFIKQYIPSVVSRLRARVVVHLVQPYERVKLEWLGEQLGVSLEEAETLVINLIKDGSIDGKMDQINMLLELNVDSGMTSMASGQHSSSNSNEFCNAVDGWMSAVKRLQASLGNKSQKIESQQNRGGFGNAMFLMDDYEYDNVEFTSFSQFYPNSFGF